MKERTPRQRGGELRGRLRDAPSHESGDVTPPESDKPPHTHDREGFLLGELVDHGLGHAQERYDLLHAHEGLAQDILGGLGRSRPSDDRRRRPAHSDNLCFERFSDVFITNSRRFRPAPAANLVSCAMPRFPEHTRGKRNPEGSSFRASSSRILARKVFADLARAGALGDDTCLQGGPGHTKSDSAE